MWLRRRATRGQALAEFALVAPIFFALLLSVIVLGLWVFYNQQLQNAAREAAHMDDAAVLAVIDAVSEAVR